MLSKIHTTPKHLLKIIGFVFLSSVVACNFSTTKPGNSPSPTPEEPTPPPVAITQEMIQAATDGGYDFLARVLQALQDGKRVNIDEADPGDYNRTALHYAIELGEVGIAQSLCGRGANVNVKAEDSETPLYIAVDKGLLELVKYLLSINGIEKDVKETRFNRTPYRLAASLKEGAENYGDAPGAQNYQAIMEALERTGANTSL